MTLYGTVRECRNVNAYRSVHKCLKTRGVCSGVRGAFGDSDVIEENA